MFRRLGAALALSTTLFAQSPIAEEAHLRAHLSFLADDLLEGRGPGQRGGRLAIRYLETQLRALGLRPARESSFLLPVKLLGIRPLMAQSSLTCIGPAGMIPLPYGTGFLVGSAAPQCRLPVDATMVFVGHGITMEGRDDFKGADVRGRILVALVGDWPGQGPDSTSPGHFVGRWRYKLAEALRRGAAGVLLVHTPARAGYGWEILQAGWHSERLYPDPAPEGAGLQGWLSESTARAIFRASGLDFDRLCKDADSDGFQPVPLPVRLQGLLASEVRRFEDLSVAAILPGTDPELRKELLVYSAHWDHLGQDPVSGKVFNGAVDNASGCAGLLAVAQALRHHPARRSQMFLFTCAEEPGLLGAEAFVASPPWPLEKIVANLNLESLNFAGPTRDIGISGAEGSSLYESATQCAREMGLAVAPARPDPGKLYFRADHFAFAKAGIPAFSPGFSLDGGWDYPNPRHADLARRFAQDRYHQPTDTYDPLWDLRGMLQQIQFTLNLGQYLANAPLRPAWKNGRPAFHRIPALGKTP
jgi:hypothetical protein